MSALCQGWGRDRRVSQRHPATRGAADAGPHSRGAAVESLLARLSWHKGAVPSRRQAASPRESGLSLPNPPLR